MINDSILNESFILDEKILFNKIIEILKTKNVKIVYNETVINLNKNLIITNKRNIIFNKVCVYSNWISLSTLFSFLFCRRCSRY